MSDILNIAKSGLLAAQAALSVTSHNVANANRAEYSRQRAEFATQTPDIKGYGYQGNGVTIGNITRLASDPLNEQLRGTLSDQEQYSSQYIATSRADQIISSPETRLTDSINRFFNALNELSNTPESIAVRQTVLSEAESLVQHYKTLDRQISNLRTELGNEASSYVSEVNSIAQSLVEVNKLITQNRSLSDGQPPSDLLDQRDGLLTKMSEMIGTTTRINANGTATVFASNGQAIVSEITAYEAKSTLVDNEIVVTIGGIRVSSEDAGGKLGGILEASAKTLNPGQALLGQVMLGVASSVNELHTQGIDLNGVAGTELFNTATNALPGAANTGGASVSVDVIDPSAITSNKYRLTVGAGFYNVTNIDSGIASIIAFGDPIEVDGLRFTISGTPDTSDYFTSQPTRDISDTIDVSITDPTEIAAALVGGGPADNRNALAMADLANSKTLVNGNATFNELYGQLSSSVALSARTSKINFDASNALREQAQVSRDSLSGVNLDEEATNMLKFQQAYEAASRLIAADNAMFNALLSAVGR